LQAVVKPIAVQGRIADGKGYMASMWSSKPWTIDVIGQYTAPMY